MSSFFYKCLACEHTFPVFSETVTACPLCGSLRIEESPEVGMGERLERGGIYELDLVSGKLARRDIAEGDL